MDSRLESSIIEQTELGNR